MNKHKMDRVQGEEDVHGNVLIRYNPYNGAKLFSPDGRKHLLPCDICGVPEWVELFTVAFVCAQCANANPDIVPGDCLEAAHCSVCGETHQPPACQTPEADAESADRADRYYSGLLGY